MHVYVCLCVCLGEQRWKEGISSEDLHHPGHLKTACSMSLVIIQASLFSSCNISRIVIPGHLPAFTSLKFLPRFPSYKTLCIFLTLHLKHAAWPWLNDRGSEGTLHSAATYATNGVREMKWELCQKWVDWGQFWLQPYTSFWGCPAESVTGR